ncbi:MAG: hypothetical protein AB7K09_12395 [Planctomycetota bacterium]
MTDRRNATAAKLRFKPNPVLCDDEAAWFSNSEGQTTDVRVSTYIRERFAGLLTKDDIARLEQNDVMRDIIARHIGNFEVGADTAADANRRVA